jgi:hypothetical protein
MTTDKQIHAAFTELADALARADDVLADYAEENGDDTKDTPGGATPDQVVAAITFRTDAAGMAERVVQVINAFPDR